MICTQKINLSLSTFANKGGFLVLPFSERMSISRLVAGVFHAEPNILKEANVLMWNFSEEI